MGIIAVLHILSYAKGFDEMDKPSDVSYNSISERFYAFIDTVFEQFGAEFLRPRREEGLRRILAISAGRGFSDYVGS